MQSPNNLTDRPRYLLRHVVVSAPSTQLDRLEQEASENGKISQQVGTALTLAPLRTEAPKVFKHTNGSWQEAQLGHPNGVLSLLKTGAAFAANQVALYDEFKQQRAAQGNLTRRYTLEDQTIASPQLVLSLDGYLNQTNNELGVTGFDITPDHIIKQTNNPHDSPWEIPARTWQGEPDQAEAMFSRQACWTTIGATQRQQFAHQGEDVTVVIMDTAPKDTAAISPKLIDFYISMAGPDGEFDPPEATPHRPGFKELYSVGRAHAVMPERPGGTDIEASLMEPYHGLLIASLIRELAPKAKIVLLEVLNYQGETTGSNLTEALDYVLFLRQNQATVEGERLVEDKLVFNLSLGIPRSLAEEAEATYLLEACDRACDPKEKTPGHQTLIVAAAGNDSYYMHPRNPQEPAAYGYFLDTHPTYKQVIAVSATGPTAGEYALYSNQGNLAAPGMDLLMDTGHDQNPGQSRYIYWAGTSFATPLVAASSALLLSSNVPADQVKQKLWSSATQPARWDGVPEINLERAM